MSKITAIVEVSFYELGKLYFFILPQIFLFTIPLSFFIGLALSLFRLSKENETIVLFTLGLKPSKIATFFGLISIIITAVLLINSLILIPLSDQLNRNFIDFKKSEAKLNIKPSEAGQRFSDWMIFVNESKDINSSRIYNDIVLYQFQNKKDQERLVLSSSANLQNIKGELNLFLGKGQAYDIKKGTIHQTQYANMVIRTISNKQLTSVNSIINYWKQITTDAKRAKNFSLYVLISIFPLCTFLFAVSFGIVTYRYQKNEIYGYIFGIIFLYFALIATISRYFPLTSIPLIFLIFTILSLKYFHKKILRFY